ncbi:putative ribonuclease H protein [Vitis vinifera]|uniref:Putative ribonuclease H protein n=1 Tax=Vitis vinifera TaxID=29760 RepID=A0A438HBB9_VITVI|nr:putative ribonuclease H protein [Vitis vinifera]
MRKFAEIVDDLGQVDLSLQGGEFTWNGGHNNQAWARLERFLVSPSWVDQFSGINQSRLPRPVSDHFPITASYKLATKMKEIKQKLKVWNRKVFGKLECNKSPALQQVEFWDRKESERILTVEETELKKEAKENYRKWVIMEETHWRHLSREIWLKEGDRNTGFFHCMASAHRRNNSFERIKINGEWLLEEQEIREGIANAFHNLLSEDMGWKVDIGRLQFDQISQQEAKNLERSFTEDEIHAALMEMNGDKVPGPDGFSMAFWQSCWDFIKEEILEMFKDFFEHSSFLKSLNNTFLVLIPKKSGVEDLGDFRPISFFLSTKGLRQGDPLSPYLFVMGMEVLDVLIRRVVEGATSGLRINLAKSEIIPVGEVVEMEELAVELGCRVGSLPSQYLGLPLGAPNRASYTWDGVEERVRRRLALWKQQYISKGGRVTLIKSTLASMSIYQMSIFRMPKVVARKLEKVQRDFLWGRGNMEGKIHLVKWEVVCTDKDKGGLGLRKLAMLNKALLGKWIWRYACDKDNLWKQVIKGRATRLDFGQMCGVQIQHCPTVFLTFLAWLFKGTEQGHKPSLEEDSVLWRQGRSGQFRVKEAHRLLAKSNDTGFPSRSIWVARVPTKVAFFAWEATWGRCLLWIDFKEEGCNFQIVASCVDLKKKV